MSSATPPPSPDPIRIHATPDAPRPAWHGRLVLGMVFVLVLVGLAAWMLWWRFFHPTVYFVGLPIAGYDVLAVPPLRFATEDVDTLTHLARPGRAVVLSELQTSRDIATLGDRLQALALEEKDVLILYLRVQGVSDDGEAWLLCSDFLRSAEGGRYSLADLLGQIGQCRAGTKLLALDAGDLGCDPRLGMIVNEFPQLLDDEVRRVKDSRLWVLAANRPLEMSHVSESEKRSAFGHFVAEGLAGAADRNGDGTIELAELVDFVRGGMTPWVAQQTRGVESQTPWLLRGGKGAVRAPADLALAPVASGGRNDGHKSAPSSSPAAKQVGVLLEEAWRLRDRMQQRSAASPWTPVDYAPHLWRAYEELLLGYERRFRSGAQRDPERVANDLRTNVLPLASVLAGEPLPPAANKAALIGRLADARGRFLAKSKEEQLDRLVKDKQVGRYLELVRLKNDLVLRARDYVRWHAAAARSASERHRVYQPIYDFLTALRQFVDQLEMIEGAASALGKTNQVDQALGSLDLLVHTLQPLRRAIEEDGLYKDAAELADAAEKDPAKTGLAGPIDSLLATPLLPAALRARLLRARSGLEQPFVAGDQSVDGAPRPPSLLQWSGRLYDQAALEEQFVGLAEPSAQFPPLQSTEVVSVRTLLSRYRWLSKALGQFYKQLPTEIDKNFQARDPAIVRRCERWLRIVDARDAEQIGEGVAAITVRGVRFPPPAKVPPAASKAPVAPKVPKPK